MDKYLEALERLAMPDELHIKECKKLGIGLTEDYDTVEKALLELTSIKKASPSEALECLERIGAEKLARGELIRNDNKLEPYISTIKQALLKAQEPKQYVDELKLVEKKLKALEIIKEKYPNVVEVKLCKDYEHYKLRMSSKHDTEIVKIDWNDKSLLDYLVLLTEEEFNLLKEVLEC